MTSGVILTNTVAVADGTVAINKASVATADNLQTSLQIVNNNAENFGGQGSAAFHQAIALVNQQYQNQQAAIAQAAQALGLANDGMTETDQQMAAQYGV
jgi:uncharacterized protein YukE